MSTRQVIILWILALVLCGAVVAVKSGTTAQAGAHTKRQPGQTLLATFAGDQATTLRITAADAQVTLVKKDGTWSVAERQNYPANTLAINELIRSLGELKVTQGIESGPSYAARFGMDASAKSPDQRGITVSLSGADGKELATVSFGKSIDGAAAMGGMSLGRFVRNHADESGIYKVADQFPSLTADPKRWLDEDFIQIARIRSIRVSQPGKTDEAWSVERTTDQAEFRIASGGGDLASTVSTQLKSLFSYARFEDVLTNDAAASLMQADAKRTVAIDTFDGFHYQLTLTPTKATAAKTASESPDAQAYLVSVQVSADLDQPRLKPADEKPEETQQRDAQYAAQKPALAAKLAKEKAFESRTYSVTPWTIDVLLKDRAALIQKAAAANPQGMPEGIPPEMLQQLQQQK